MTIDEMRAKRASLLDQSKALLAKADAEKRDLTDEETAAVQAMTRDAAALKDEAEKAQAKADAVAAARVAVADLDKPVARRMPDAVASHPLSARESVLDDPKRGFRSLGDFAVSVAAAYSPGGQVDPRLRPLAAAGTGMTQGVVSEGGIFVPPSFGAGIWDGLRERSDSMMSRCDQVPVDPSVESIEFPAIAETSRADGSRWGGLRGYWKSELASLTESRPALRGVKVSPNELYVFAYVSDKLLRNSPVSLDGFLREKAIDEMAFKIGDGIWNGTGAGQPHGILDSAALVSVSKETGQAAATVVAQNVIKMEARLHPAARAGAAWYVSPQVKTQLAQMALAVGTGGQLVYMGPQGLAGAQPMTLLGYPVVVTEFNAALGTVGDIVLANLRYYLVAYKGSVDAQASMHLKFDYAQTAFRFIWEVDGTPWVNAAVTPFKDTGYTLSPFVALATRS